MESVAEPNSQHDSQEIVAEQALSEAEDRLIEIENAEQACISAESVMLDLKEQLKHAKSEYEGCVDRLRRLARAWHNDKDRPLLNLDEKPDRPWAGVSLENIEGITDSQMRKLADANLHTVGDVATFTETGELVDIEGIGPKAAESIGEALAEFWNSWDADAETDESDDD